MIIVFLGPPGAGKGTQADVLHDNFGFFHFDTGSRLREETASGSDLGRRIAAFTEQGQLVPIEIIRELILKFLRAKPADRLMFDGFPRNLEQAGVLAQGLADTGLSLDHAIYLEIDEDSLLERIINRRFCSKCGQIYNLVSNAPRLPGACDLDGAELVQRKDDTAEVFGTRLKVYLEQTKPVLAYYEERSLLRRVDGNDDIPVVARAVAKELGL